MIFDVITVIVLERHKPYKMANLINVVCVLTAPPPAIAPTALTPWPPYSVRHNNIEIRPINNPITTSKCSSERKTHVSLTLNQKLDVKFSERGIPKAKTGQKLGLLHS